MPSGVIMPEIVEKKKEEKRIPCLVFSRVVGYMQPVNQWNKGKQQEFEDRQEYELPEETRR